MFDNADDLKVRIIAYYDKIDETCCGVINLQQSAATQAIFALGGQVSDANDPFADIVSVNFDSSNDIENKGISGQIDYDLGAFTLTSITAYRESDLATDQDSDFTTTDLIGRNFADTVLETFTQELRVSGEIVDRLGVLLGAFYFNESIEQTNQLFYGQEFREYANLLIAPQLAALGPNDLAILDLEATIGALTGRNLTNRRISLTSGALPLATTLTGNTGVANTAIFDRPRNVALQASVKF